MVSNFKARSLMSRRCGCAIGLAFVLTVFASGFAHAQGSESRPAAVETVTSVPKDLTREEVPRLVSRLSDEDVRALLIRYLENNTPAQGVAQDPSSFIGGLHASLAHARERFRLMTAAIPSLPSVWSFLIDELTMGQPRDIIWRKLLFALIIFGGGFAAEWMFRRLFSRFAEAAGGSAPDSLSDKFWLLALRLARDLLALVVFGLAAAGFFFVFYEGHRQTREIVATIFWAVLLYRLVGAVGRFALAPKAPSLRLPPVDDAAAENSYSRLLLVAGSIIAAAYISALLKHIGLDEGRSLTLSLILASAVLALIIALLWIDRTTIGRLIVGGTMEGGEAPGRLRQILAANWHVFASCMIALFWLLALGTRLLTGKEIAGPLITSLCVLLAIPIVNWILKVALSAALNVRGPNAAKVGEAAIALDPSESNTAAAESAALAQAVEPNRRNHESRIAYRSVLVRNLRVVVVVLALIILARVWEVDVQGVAALGIGETVAGSLFNIVITLILASAAWGILKTAIRHAVPEEAGDAEMEAGEAGGQGGSRLQTLIPLLGRFLLVVLVVMVGLIILSELGVNIGPLIAGAGIFGLAIGFGAQTLVKDILSGMFFLLDDAFRIGEYVNVGSAQGTVEHISIRSLRLRHHNGPLHTIPFGEIAQLTNFSRDWAIMKLELRIPFDADLEKVRKLIKKVGLGLEQDPEHGPNFLQPVKSQGVNRMDDSAFIVRVKFMAKPGEQFTLRREVFRRIQEAFAKNGIQFAPRRVIVDTEAGQAAAAAAAAAVMADSGSEASAAPSKGPDG